MTLSTQASATFPMEMSFHLQGLIWTLSVNSRQLLLVCLVFDVLLFSFLKIQTLSYLNVATYTQVIREF